MSTRMLRRAFLRAAGLTVAAGAMVASRVADPKRGSVAAAGLPMEEKAVAVSTQADDDALVAIDVLLEPDQAMMQQAIGINARLLGDYSKGFPLGTEQVPHITLVQLFVRAADLPQVKAAVAGALGGGNSLVGRQLTGIGVTAAVMGSIALAALDVERTPELQQLHERVVQAVTPFAVQGGSSAAFSTSTSLPTVPPDSWIVEYVQTFIATQAGEHYYPHITLGMASAEFTRQVAAEPFPRAPFMVARLAVRHLGEHGTAQQELATIPLPSWSDGEAKQRILTFVKRVTDPSSPDYVAPSERIATFDNDGTLWSEQPFYFQGYFILDRVRALAPQHPEWQTQQPFQAILANDAEAMRQFTEHDLAALAAATHTGMTPDDFNAIAKTWLASATQPRFGQLFTACVYQPMVELLAYLRGNGFKTFIVSGGGKDFIRAFAEQAYGIPPEQVVGSSVKTTFEQRDGTMVLLKLPELGSYDDNAGKPMNIDLQIGRRPILAFGNSDGDQQMLEYTAAGAGQRLMLLLHHDDAEREYAYDRASTVGRLDKALDEAAARQWTVVSMKQDFKRVFAFDA